MVRIRANKLSDKQLKAWLTKGGRPGAKTDFNKILGKAAKPIDKKR